MLDRVGSWSIQQTMINEYTRIQSRSTVTQQQIATGRVGDSYADTREKAGILASAKMKASEVESFKATTQQAMSRIDMQDLHLQQLSDMTARLREVMGDALATGHAPALMDQVNDLYEEAVTLLNTRIDGKYIYAGSRADTAPVNAPTLADLQAAVAVADVFENSDLKQSQRVDEAQTVEIGLTASDMATDLFQMFKDVADFNVSVDGPFGVDLTAVQSTFLNGQHASAKDVQAGVNTIAAINGARHEQLTLILDRHESMTSYLAKFTGDIENVDVAAAITRLNQDQVAAQAAARMISQINTMSLLDFLPL